MELFNSTMCVMRFLSIGCSIAPVKNSMNSMNHALTYGKLTQYNCYCVGLRVECSSFHETTGLSGWASLFSTNPL